MDRGLASRAPRAVSGVLRLLPLLIWMALLPCEGAWAQSLEQSIDKIIHRPEYRHASFGIEFFSLDTGQPVYRLNSEQLFVPASTTKLVTEGAALELLGADYRFHTRIYRTGPISADGTLAGDLVLVAAGDPNLSGRQRADGTLAFEDEDHTYGGSPDARAVPGDPLLVLRELAEQVVAQKIRRITGHVLVDASLFPEGTLEEGTETVVSPLSLNDNIVDVTVGPGDLSGARGRNVAAKVRVSPQTPYVRFKNEADTGAPGSGVDIRFVGDVVQPDGSHTVTIVGSVPAGSRPILFAYRVPQPSRFAEMALAAVLREDGVAVNPAPGTTARGNLHRYYKPENVVAEHVSAPLSEEIKVTLKTSQNLHASMMPYDLGVVLAHAASDPSSPPDPQSRGIEQAGYDLEREFLLHAGLDLSGASQGDGAGGSRAAYFTPDFIVQYLVYMSQQKNFRIFHDALPILGRDGTLWNIQTDSAAAGHVYAKTGTFSSYDALNRRTMLNGKGLAGYLTTLDGRHLVFAVYANGVLLPDNQADPAQSMVGQALGEIAAAAYSAPPETPDVPATSSSAAGPRVKNRAPAVPAAE